MSIVAKLGGVAEFIRGVTFKPNQLVEFGSQDFVVCMRTKNVQKDLDASDLISIPRHIVKNETKFLKEGDLLISTANSFELVGKACWVPKLDYPAAAGGFISILRAKEGVVDPRYLYHWVKTGKTQHLFRHCGRQTTNISNMDFGRAKELEIPLPPLEEQKRIAAILDKADAVRRKRQQAIDLTDQLLRSVFFDMFGDPVTNPKRLPTALLGDVSKRVTDGTHQSPNWTDSGVPFLFIRNIVNQEILFNVEKYISEESWHELTSRCPIETGDVLYTTVGSYGNAALVKGNTRFCFQRHIAHIKPKKELIHPTYLWVMMNSPGVKKQADKQARGIAQKTLNLRELKEFVVFVPTMEEQEKFVKLVDKLKLRLEKLHSQSKLDEMLFSSLNQQAFRGELTKQTEAA